MPSLFQIDEAIREAIDRLVDRDTGELSEDAEAIIDALDIDRKQKLRAYAAVILELQGDAAVTKKEEQRLKELRERTERRVASLEKLLRESAPPREQPLKRGTKGTRVVLEDPILPISYSTSVRLEIVDREKVPTDFTEEVVTTKVLSTELKAFLKERVGGSDAGFAKLTDNFNLRVGK